MLEEETVSKYNLEAVKRLIELGFIIRFTTANKTTLILPETKFLVSVFFGKITWLKAIEHPNSCIRIDMETVLGSVPDNIRDTLLFNLDLFR